MAKTDKASNQSTSSVNAKATTTTVPELVARLRAMSDVDFKAFVAAVALERKERRTVAQPAFAIGTRVKVVNPKDPDHGKVGTVEFSTTRNAVVDLGGRRLQKQAKNLSAEA